MEMTRQSLESNGSRNFTGYFNSTSKECVLGFAKEIYSVALTDDKNAFLAVDINHQIKKKGGIKNNYRMSKIR